MATDITVVFQQGTEKRCEYLFQKANSAPPQWLCQIALPSTGLSAAAADPTGIAVWTSKQTRSKTANYAFTYLEAELPVYSWHSPEAGPAQGSSTTVEFNNYCQLHDKNDVSITFTEASGSSNATIQSYSYNGDCTTTLSMSFPNLADGYESTVTVQVTPDKSFTFGYNFHSKLFVDSAVTTAMSGSAPEVTLTLINLKATSSGATCDADSCVTDHNLQVVFGTQPGQPDTLLGGPSGCVEGVCNVRVQAPTLTDHVTVTVSNQPSTESTDYVATFELGVFEYDCASFCSSSGKIQNQALIVSQPPLSSACLEEYCKAMPIRSSRIESVSNLAAGGQAECQYNANCELTVVAVHVTASILTASNLGTHIFVTFGGTNVPLTSASAVAFDSQEGDTVTLRVTTPIMSTAADYADITVSGYDETGVLLQAVLPGEFRFKQVA